MFVTVSALTQIIDRELGYVADAIAHHECSEEEYQKYIADMKDLESRRLNRIKEISTNQKLIKRYEYKIADAFKEV